MVKWFVAKKMNPKPSAITVRPSHSKDEEGVDFVVNVPSPNPINSLTLNPLSPHQSIQFTYSFILHYYYST